ncbi:MAG: FAD-binding protein [Chloroflexota bacterium]
MKIAVCVKQVPDLEALEFDAETRTIKREGVLNLVNTFEKHALTAAKRLVELAGEGEVTVLTMGPPQAKDALMEMLAAGADRAVHLNDRAFAGADTLATSRALAAALRQGQYDLIFCGKYSLDAETGQVGPEVAELLDIPQATAVCKIDLLEDNRLAVTRMTDEGYEELELSMPALLTVPEDVAPPARPNKAGREAAPSKPYQVLAAADLDADVSGFGLKGSATWVQQIRTIKVERHVRMIEGEDLRLAARTVVKALLDDGLFSEWKAGGEVEEAAPDSREISDNRAVWVVAELFDGKVRPVTFELLGEGLRLARRLGSELGVLLAGHGVASLAAELAVHGADTVYLADDPRIQHYDTERYTGLLADAIQRLKPYAVLLPSTANGRDLAPRVAARLRLGLTGDCVGFDLDSEDRLVQLKPAFGGNIVAPILSSTRPQMATVRPGVLRAVKPNRRRQARIERLDLGSLPAGRVRRLSAEPSVGAKGIDLETASIVVGAGYGMGSPANLGLIEDLAHVLGGAVSATRKIVDLAWMPRQQQVGLTGKVIAPKLYVAVGIRGFFNHTIGIQKAGIVLAINTDSEAPIFQVSDYGVVADAMEFLPIFTEELRAAAPSRP